MLLADQQLNIMELVVSVKVFFFFLEKLKPGECEVRDGNSTV